MNGTKATSLIHGRTAKSKSKALFDFLIFFILGKYSHVSLKTHKMGDALTAGLVTLKGTEEGWKNRL